MKSIFTLFSLIAALALAVPSSTIAADKKKSDDSSDSKGDSKKKDTYPYYGEVAAVTDSLLTLKGSKANREFVITKDTKIHNKPKDSKEDKPATIKDVKVGAWVGGLAKKAEDGKGTPTALNLNVGVTQKGEKKEADAKPAAKTDSKTDASKTDAAKTDKTDDKTTTKKTKKKKTTDSTDSTTTPPKSN